MIILSLWLSRHRETLDWFWSGQHRIGRFFRSKYLLIFNLAHNFSHCSISNKTKQDCRFKRFRRRVIGALWRKQINAPANFSKQLHCFLAIVARALSAPPLDKSIMANTGMAGYIQFEFIKQTQIHCWLLEQLNQQRKHTSLSNLRWKQIIEVSSARGVAWDLAMQSHQNSHEACLIDSSELLKNSALHFYSNPPFGKVPSTIEGLRNICVSL